MQHVLVVDVGTSSLKSMLYTEKGDLLFRAGQSYDSIFGHENDVEQDPQTWNSALVNTLTKAGEYCGDKGIAVDAIIVTSQRASVIPMSRDGEPLYNAVMWQDKRALKQCEKLLERFTLQDMYHRTGLRVNPYFSVPKMMWLRDNRSEIFNSAHKLIGVQDYVAFLLTGKYATDVSQACRTMLMNIRTSAWDKDMLDASGISTDLLPELVPSGSQVNVLTDKLAAQVGLKSGIPVYLGGGDQQCAALSLGILGPGEAEANTGTGSFVIAYAEQPHFHPDCTTLCSASAMPGKWIVEAGIFTTGLVHRWFKENFYPDTEDAYDIMNREAESSPIGANGVMMPPHFEGSAAPYWNPRAKGMFFNITMATRRADMARAVIEGISLEIGHNLELLQSLGVPVERVSVAGGLTTLDTFNQIQADVFNKRVIRYENNEASSLGALMSACVSMGIYSDYTRAFEGIVTSEPRIFEPQTEAVNKYKTVMHRKKRLYDALNKSETYDLFSAAI
ncbi:FGGY-family carbohydrate kinase [Microvirga sp. W0021]|uniref:FGGY-family carbohydrate kinase n=1 Tax=Hohaiivirga grylli TaxID=3133970 RepID=A0ABV0BM02_9HYPH